MEETFLERLSVRTGGRHALRRTYLVTTGCATMWVFAASAMAQTADPQPTTPPDSRPVPQSSGVEDIVVTAQRREENLQDVPIAITAISARTLEAQGVSGVANLGQLTPGLNIARDTQAPQIFIRGVGTTAVGPGQESSNAVYVDGIYIGTPAAAFIPFNNIERIEVLKGPQGTLFGRNATGGLIHIVTRDPSFTTKAQASVGYGNYDTIEDRLYLSTGLTDGLAIDGALYYRNQGNGWGKNFFTGKDVYRSREFAARSKLLWNLSDTTTIRVSGDYAKGKSDLNARQLTAGSVASGGRTQVGGFYDINSNIGYGLDYTSKGVSARIEQELPWARIVSLTGYRTDSVDYILDVDATPLSVLEATPVHYSTRQLTQELQLQALPGSRVQWIAGLYYLRGSVDLGPVRRFGSTQAAIGGYFDAFARQVTKSYSAFAQATVPLGERTRLTAGGRYTIDKRALTGYEITALNIRRNIVDTGREWKSPTWRFSLDHDLTDGALVYASYSRGFKSGMYSPFTATSPAVSPEKIDAYEVGTKLDLLDRTLRLNLSAYYYDYKDLQLTVRIGATNVAFNAASARVKGLDAELIATPVRGLTLRGGLNLLDGQYGAFPNAPFTLPAPAICGNPPVQAPGPRTGGNATCSGDASGNRMIQAPKFTYNLGANYKLETGVGDFTADVGLYHNSGYFFEPDNRLRQRPYSVVNAQLSWMPVQHYRVSLWANNILGEKYFTYLSSTVTDAYTPAAPSTYGATLAFDF